MKKMNVVWAAAIGLLTLSVAAGHLNAAADDATNAAVNGIADLLQKGDANAAMKAAKAAAAMKDKDVEDFMSAFKLRAKKGIGVGSKANDVQPDGIEKKLESLSRDGIAPAALKKESDALVRAGHVIAAVAHVAKFKAPEKDVGKAKKADWIKWADELANGSADFAGAAKNANAADLKKAASKIVQTCESCHAVFK